MDSGAMIEHILATDYPSRWQDGRSDNKGPEPEALELVSIGDWVYALVGLERTSGFMVFDITDPGNVVYQSYIYNLTDLAPEGASISS